MPRSRRDGLYPVCAGPAGVGADGGRHLRAASAADVEADRAALDARPVRESLQRLLPSAARAHLRKGAG
eukprot:2837144-Pleurochrysis_carterae.AAC.1